MGLHWGSNRRRNHRKSPPALPVRLRLFLRGIRVLVRIYQTSIPELGPNDPSRAPGADHGRGRMSGI